MSLFYFELLDFANAADASVARKKNSRTRWANNAFALPPTKFIKRFRLTKSLVLRLVRELTPYLPRTKRADGLDVTTKILITLQCLATNSYQTQVGDLKHLSVSQSSVSKVLHQVITALNNVNIFRKYVKFPRTRSDREEIKRGFYRKFNFPGVLGCVDGTQVSILRPILNEERYFNRKGYHSLNVMIICDSNMQVTCVDPSYPGSTHDSVVWNNHPLKQQLHQLKSTSDEEFFLLGDSGYPLRNILLTPILNAEPDTPEAFYTEMHVRTRNVVERCIGILKSRFRCLLAARMLHYRPTTAAQIVNACCILHNIAHGHNIPYVPLTPEELQQERILTQGAHATAPPPQPHSSASNDLQEGRAVRARVARNLWIARL